jgi:hypothetical protein
MEEKGMVALSLVFEVLIITSAFLGSGTLSEDLLGLGVLVVVSSKKK